VTNEEFRKFVDATKHVTSAERAPNPDDYPGAKPELLVPASVVFQKPKQQVNLNDCFQWWTYVPGANWRHPEGPASSLKGRAKHPVVQLAYEDVEAYAKWIGKELPTEAEWEFAARGGLAGAEFVWGDEFTPGGKYMANTWQGEFPWQNLKEDGFEGIAPVGSFPPNAYGLQDVAGNVWEWVSDWYRPDYYAELAATGTIARNPNGPADSLDPSEPGVQKRVHRGGSFLCTDQYCMRYQPGGRGKGEASIGASNVGFRLVLSPVQETGQSNSPDSVR